MGVFLLRAPPAKKKRVSFRFPFKPIPASSHKTDRPIWLPAHSPWIFRSAAMAGPDPMSDLTLDATDILLLARRRAGFRFPKRSDDLGLSHGYCPYEGSAAVRTSFGGGKGRGSYATVQRLFENGHLFPSPASLGRTPEAILAQSIFVASFGRKPMAQGAAQLQELLRSPEVAQWAVQQTQSLSDPAAQVEDLIFQVAGASLGSPARCQFS